MTTRILPWAVLPEMTELPDGWDLVPFAQACEVVMGQSPPSATYSTDGQGLPFLQGNAQFGPHRPLPHVWCDAATKRSRPGDTLMSVRAPVGEINRSDVAYGIGRGLCAVRGPQLDGDFVYYAMHRWRHPLVRVGQGSTYDAITNKEVAKLWAVVPPLPEQRKIAAILRSVDEAIERTEAVIAALREVKRGMMQELLTRGIGHREFVGSSVGPIPSGWRLRALPTVAEYQNGKAFPSEEYGDHGVPLLRPGNLPGGEFVEWDADRTTCLPEAWATSARGYVVGGGEIIMNLTAQSLEEGFLGRVCMTRPGTYCLLNQRLARFRATDCHLPFLFWQLRGQYFRRHVERVRQGLKIQHLYNRDLETALLPMPDDHREQEEIADALFGVVRQEEAGRASIVTLQTLKRGLMQQLLTGKVRVIPR